MCDAVSESAVFSMKSFLGTDVCLTESQSWDLETKSVKQTCQCIWLARSVSVQPIRKQMTETDLWMTQLSIDQEQTERVQRECLL